MVLRRRILDVESQIEKGILRMDFIVEKERYPIRLEVIVWVPKTFWLMNGYNGLIQTWLKP